MARKPTYEELEQRVKELEQESDRLKQTQEELSKSEEHNRLILEVIPDIIIQTNAEGEFLDVRSYSEELLARPKEELVGQRIQDVLPDKEADRVMECIRTALATSSLQSVEYELWVPAGKRSFEARVIPSGEERVIVFIRDITERKRAEDALMASEKKLANI